MRLDGWHLGDHLQHRQRGDARAEQAVDVNDATGGQRRNQLRESWAADGIERDTSAQAVCDPLHLSDQIGFFRGDHMRRAGVEELLLLRRGAGQRDGRRTRIVGDLDRREANATGRRRDENEVALGDLRVLDERTIGGHEHHPD